jgi:hypothetical protein
MRAFKEFFLRFITFDRVRGWANLIDDALLLESADIIAEIEECERDLAEIQGILDVMSNDLEDINIFRARMRIVFDGPTEADIDEAEERESRIAA